MRILIIYILLFINQIVVGQTTPTITSSSNASIPENTTAIIKVTATDPDLGDTQTYSIFGGLDASKFSISSTTGDLSFITPPNFEVPTDNNTDNIYEVTVQVIGIDLLFATQTITVAVTNVSETAPTITSALTAVVPENTTVVMTVTATDPDIGDTKIYSIFGGLDASKFSISSTTGVLSFITAPDFEIPTDNNSDNIYEVIVHVTDKDLLFAAQNILVTVTNVNDNNPVITATDKSIPENTTAVETITATDADAGDTKTFSITGVDAGRFTIGASTGVLVFASSPDFETPLDIGLNNVYDLMVMVTDAASHTDSKAIAITVTNVNDNNPVIIATDKSIPENTTAVETITATDADAGDTKTFSITGGADVSKFSINSGTGLLVFASAPDYEIPTDVGANNVYDVIVSVTDAASHADSKAIAITVTNVNEAPTITNGTNISVSENTVAVTTITIIDPDAGDSKTFSIGGGADAGKFTIGLSNGVLAFSSAPDFEHPSDANDNNIYEVTVQVSDGGGLTNSKAFSITVNNVNESPTNIVLNSTSINENVEANFIVGTLSSEDPEGGAFIYTFVTGAGDADNGSFNIIGNSLRINSSPDFETKSSYNIRLRTTDQGGLFFEKAVTISINNLNEPPLATAVNITGNTTVCKTLTGNYAYSDPEGDNQGTSAFQWYRADNPVGIKTAISGATSTIYILTVNDQNKYIYFEVTPKALTGALTGTPVTSAASALITNLLPTVSISSVPGTFCQGKNANLNFTFTGSPPFTLTYTNGTADYSITSSSTSYSTTITQGGTYKGKTLIDNLNCVVLETDLPSIANVTVNPLPTVKITGLNTAYNVNNNPVVMQGTPVGGTFSGEGVVPSTNTFYPSIAGVPNSPHPIVYIYTLPATGCSNTDTVKVTIMDAEAVIDGFRVQNKYCKFDKPFIISGANSAGAMGTFSISGGIGLVNHNNNTATISPSALGVGSYTVTYTYLNIVQLSISKSFSVETAFPAHILNLPAAVYCSNIPDIKLLGTYNSAAIYGIFSGNGIVKKADSLYYFKPTVATVGSSYIYYTNTENYGCKTSDSVRVTIAASPKSMFEVANKCWNGDSTIFVNLSTPVSSINNNYWNFGDSQATETDNKSILKNPKHKYLSAGSKIVQLVSVANGCKDTVVNTINLGGIPNLDFSWNTECFNTGIPINFKSIITGNNAIGSYNWTIKGSGSNVIKYTTANISHSFTLPGDYKVNLLANTTANCKDSIQKQIRVRPSFSLKDTSYSMDFENGRQYWYENENTTNKWMFGKPVGTNIKSTYSGINSFYTAITNNLNQQLIVSSPCFDFSQTTKPFIELWINGDNPKDKEGAVLQYQFEDSVNWSTLGAINSGINWYNSGSIESGPGNQKLGWSGSTSGWVSARHSLDKLNGHKNVRFRIVYATNSSITGRDGFAFDNIFIGQRNKSILFEHFANNSSSLSNQSNDKVSELLNSSPADLISLQYHTSFPGSDSLNSNNQSDPGARVLYYGVGSIPVGIVNGGTDSKYIYDFSNNIPNSSDINLLSVKDAEYQFNISAGMKNSVISGTINVQASKDIPLRQTTVYIAIAEDITVQSSGKQVIYYNVVKKILPSAAGTPLRIALVKGQTVPVPFSWTVSKMYNSDRIKVIVFIQDENTREIYQVASSNNKLFTSVDDLSEASTALLDMKIYPNPANNQAFISFENELINESVLQVIDSYGRIVKNIQVLPHSSLIEISVIDLPNGLYFVRLVHKNGHSRTLKLLIAH